MESQSCTEVCHVRCPVSRPSFTERLIRRLRQMLRGARCRLDHHGRVARARRELEAMSPHMRKDIGYPSAGDTPRCPSRTAVPLHRPCA